MQEGVANGINLSIVEYIGPINVLPTFYSGPNEGPRIDPNEGIFAKIVFAYNGF